LCAKENLYVEGLPIIKLHDPNAFHFTVPTEIEDHDPLEDVAEEIRQKIDPKYKDKWPGGYKKDFVEVIEEIHSQYDEFWKRIPPEARLYIDLDNDGEEELFVISQGLNKGNWWGFDDFICILKKGEWWRGDKDESWQIAYFTTFDGSKDVWGDDYFYNYSLAICDLDDNLRGDILFTYCRRGGSASAYYLRIISLGIDMEYRDHKLWSRRPVTVLEPDSLRPLFIQHDDDRWRRMDCGVSVRRRGYRRAYHNWTVEEGFYPY